LNDEQQALDTTDSSLSTTAGKVDKKHAHEQNHLDGIEEHLQHFKQVVEQGPVVVMVTNIAGNIEYVNPKFELVTGYSADEVIGKNPRFLKSGETSKEQYVEMWETISSGRDWRGIFLNKKKSGDYYWEQALISPVVDATGKFTHYVGIKEDITQIREIEREIEEQRLKYFHQSKMADVGLLAASILHEVANPIAAIHGIISAQLKEIEEGKSSGPENMQLALTLVNRLSDITYEISEFTSPHPDKRELVDFNSIIRSTCHLVSFDSRWKNITLSIDLEKEIPAISGYKDQLSHLLVNLLVNAADAVAGNDTSPAKIQVRTHLDNNTVKLLIKDNGHGMTEEIIAHATEPFFTTKRAGKGTGLGLSLCDSIIKNHDGKLTIESLVGLGSDICIEIPVEVDA
jgi:PAS domain S-box-containing protein